MRARNVAILLVLAVMGTAIVSHIDGLVARADQEFGFVAGSFALTFTDAKGNAPPLHMWSMFTRDGQILSSHETDFGFMPAGTLQSFEGCDPDVPGAPRPNEKHTAGFGSWYPDGASVAFTVLSRRYDPSGTPIGTVRATGTAWPSLLANNNIGVTGTGFLDFFGTSQDPVTGTPACSIDVTFRGEQIPKPTSDIILLLKHTPRVSIN